MLPIEIVEDILSYIDFMKAFYIHKADYLKNIYDEDMHVEKISYNGDIEIAKYIVDNNLCFDDEDGICILAIAGDIPTLEKIKNENLDTSMIVYYAVIYNNLKIVKWLVENNCFIFEYRDNIGRALENAAYRGYLEMVKFLANYTTPTYDTYEAAYHYNEVKKWLLENDENIKNSRRVLPRRNGHYING